MAVDLAWNSIHYDTTFAFCINSVHLAEYQQESFAVPTPAPRHPPPATRHPPPAHISKYTFRLHICRSQSNQRKLTVGDRQHRDFESGEDETNWVPQSDHGLILSTLERERNRERERETEELIDCRIGLQSRAEQKHTGFGDWCRDHGAVRSVWKEGKFCGDFHGKVMERKVVDR
ncbi:hypothetical protein ACFX14_011405 [Malus domestica]